MRFAALLLGAWLCAVPAAAQRAEKPARVRLVPQFTAGQSLRYQMDFRTVTEGSTESPVEDPQAPRWMEISVAAVVRMDVLDVAPSPGGGFREARLRVTYEKLASTTRAELADPRLGQDQAGPHPLEGRSLEFTLGADGAVRDIRFPEQLALEEQTAVRDWLAQLSLGVRHPPEGIAPGEKWSLEKPKALPTPLVGLTWRTESTYLRNEACRPAALSAEGATPAHPEETCAVILTRFETVQRSPRDPTPPEYRERGLRTSGTAGGSGESLSYVSLATGLAVSVTHSGEEQMDLTVAAADGSAAVRYRGRVRSHSQITLVAEPPDPPR